MVIECEFCGRKGKLYTVYSNPKKNVEVKVCEECYRWLQWVGVLNERVR